MLVSAITSSSNRDIANFVREISLVGLDRLDLFLVRKEDLKSIIGRLPAKSEARSAKSTIQLLGIDDPQTRQEVVDATATWLSEKLSAQNGRKVAISAAATYIPQIAINTEFAKSISDKHLIDAHAKAKNALVSVIRIMCHPSLSADSGPAVIEVVCGSKFDLVKLRNESYIVESTIDSKCRNIARTLSEVVDECSEYNFSFALEVEPDSVFLMNSLEVMKKLLEECKSHPNLDNRIAFNLDLAHYFLAGISAKDVFELGRCLQMATFLIMPQLIHATGSLEIGELSKTGSRQSMATSPYYFIRTNNGIL